MLTFLEWMHQLNEGFTVPPQREGDLVYFGVHDVLDQDDKKPLDLRNIGHNVSRIDSVGNGHVVVQRPQKSRHRGMKKMMHKDDGLLKIPTGHLQQIPDELVVGGDANHKLFIYAPGNYHRRMIDRKNRRMMAADSLPQPALPAPSNYDDASDSYPGQSNGPAYPSRPWRNDLG